MRLGKTDENLNNSPSAPFRGLQTLPRASYGPYLHFRSPPKSVQGPDPLIFTSLSQLFQENPLCHFFLYLSRYEHIWVPKALISRDMVISGTTPLASQDLGSSLSRYGHIWGPTPVTSGSWLFFQEDLRPYFLLYQQKGKSQR